MRALILAFLLLAPAAYGDEIYLNLSSGWEILDDNWGINSPIITIELEWANDWCGCSLSYEHKSLLTEGFPFNQRGEVTVDEIRVQKRIRVFEF